MADSLKSKLEHAAAPETAFLLYQEIIEVYSHFNADSVVVYCDRAISYAHQLGDSANQQKFRLERDVWYPVFGVVKEAIDDLELIEHEGVYPQNRVAYLRACVRIYNAVSTFYPTVAHADRYKKIVRDYALELADTLDKDDPIRQLALGMAYDIDNNFTLAKSMYLDVFESPSAASYERSRAAAMLGDLFIKLDNNESALFYYAAAALINAREGFLTYSALESVGKIFYDRKDVGKAYHYLYIALETSVMSGNKLAAMRIAEIMPSLSNDYYRQTQMRFRFLVVACGCLLIALVFIVYGWRRVRTDNVRLHELRQQLRRSDMMKEAAISNFLGLCLIYMERLEDFARMARRKISAGQVDSLFNQLKSGKITDDQNKVVYEVFDTAFNRMYPRFIEEVNKLLQPERQLTTPAPGVLNTELRVLAFMRLGVDDTALVARILGLSVNTVYTYRNKLRTRALDRSTFEAEVMKIGNVGDE